VAVYTSIVTLLIGIGIGVLALGGSDDFRVAKACFVVVGFYTAAKVVHVAIRYGDWGTYPLFALAVAGCLWFCIEASRYVDRKRDEKLAKETRLNDTTIKQDKPDFLVQKFHMTTQSIPSSSDEYPYALKLVIQTNQPVSPVKFIIECSGPIGTAQAYPAKLGVAMLRMNDPAGQSNVFRYRQDSPPLTPDNPIEVYLASAKRITCKLVY